MEMTSDSAIKLFGKKIPLSSNGESPEASGDDVASSGVNSEEEDGGSEKVRLWGMVTAYFSEHQKDRWVTLSLSVCFSVLGCDALSLDDSVELLEILELFCYF